MQKIVQHATMLPPAFITPAGEVFWSTDWGRLLDAALRQGDPDRFQPLGPLA